MDGLFVLLAFADLQSCCVNVTFHFLLRDVQARHSGKAAIAEWHEGVLRIPKAIVLGNFNCSEYK